MARFTITINATLNGKTCKNPQIEFIQGSDVIYPCEISGNQITIETLPGTNPNACIEGYIKCDDDCLNCPPQYFKKCLCNDVTLLNSCQICKDGLIEEICTPEEIAAGKICSPNGCICPPDKPITDPNTGQCVVCITGTVSPTNPCQICIAGGWAIVDCGPNERCVNGECECIPPYVKDPLTGECKLKDECLDDEDCPTCKTCILGKCEPVKCPEGFQCINDECVPACTNVNCNNGADCGENCGCLDGKCVPCTILSCLDQASCQAALGCKCSGDKCEPVDNCGQYCDGSTPCLDTNCTCYNNECVSCKNFPCEPDECSNRYNCGCNNGECDGGGDGDECKDEFELVKKESCESNGCELEATFKTEKGCKCDPIEFRTKNTRTIAADTPTSGRFALLTLAVEMYRNGAKYQNFKNTSFMGDDELVDVSIKTIVTHRVDDKIVTPNVVPVPSVSADGENAIPEIPINFSHVVSKYLVIDGDKTVEKPTVVTIELRAESPKVANNDCTNYNSDIIATYVLDFTSESTWTATKNKINGVYKVEVSKKVNDDTSVRRPLFIWYKSNTGTFGTNKYVNNGTYNQNGFFRKEYGIASGGTWKDKVNNPAVQDLPDQNNELWNNLNYKVTVDCGCKANNAVLNDVVFCCTDKITYTLSECNRRITVPPFNVCSVNRNLASLNSSSYKIPEQAQTYFWLIINGTKEMALRVDGGEVVSSPFVYTHDVPIESIKFEQRYKGNPLVPVSCAKSTDVPFNGADFDVTSECGKIIVTKKSTGPGLSSVTGKKGDKTIDFAVTQAGVIYTSTDTNLKESGDVDVTVNFQGACILTKKVSITCPPEIDVTQTDLFAKGECNGTNPDIIAEVVSGFTSAVLFSIDGVNYVAPDAITPKIKKTFTNKPAGTYTVYAKETINGQEVIATKQVTILPVKIPTIQKVDICGNTPGEVKLTGGAPGSVWSLSGPGVSPSQFSLDSTGNSVPISIPFSSPGGVYTVTLVSDASGASCPNQSLSITINKDGGQITPQIIFQTSPICRGGEVLFKIEDGGSDLTYNLQVDGQAVGFITDLNDTTITQVTAGNSFNAKLKLNPQSNATSATIRIISIVGQNTCFTLTPNITSTIAILDGPSIGKHTISCSLQLIGRYNVTVEVFGTATEVTISGVSLLNTSLNTWSGQDIIIPGAGLNVNINASNNGTCPDTKLVFLKDCSNQNDFCPSQEIEIVASPQSPTCGSVDVAIGFLSSNITPLAGQEYAWYEIIGSVQSMISSGTIVGIAPPALQILSTSTPREYMLAIKTKNGACEYYSNIVEVVSSPEINPIIFGAGISPDTTTLVTGSTYSYSTGLIPGATYSWTLTNSNGSNQPIGTNSNTISISSFTGGSNTINVTVTLGACTGSSSAIVNVGLTCPQVTIGYVAQSGDNTCKNLAATINNSPVGVTPVSYIWYVDGVSTQTGTGVPAIFDASAVLAGDTVDITIQITFSNGCIVTGPINPSTGLVDPFEYTRCSCLCSNNTCVTSFTPTSVAGQTVVYNTPAGISSDIYVWFKAGGFPDRLTIEKGAILLLDTLQVGKGVPYAIEKTLSLIYNSILLDDISTPVGTLLQTYTTQSYTGTCASSTPVSPLISPIVNTVLGVVAERSNNYGQLNGEVGVYVKIPFSAHNGQSLTLTGIPSQVEMCANPSSTHQSNQAIFQISCSPILEAGTI